MWIKWRRQQQQQQQQAAVGAGAGVKADATQYHVPRRQQQQRGRVDALQAQQEEDMKSPPVPTQRHDIQGQASILILCPMQSGLQ
jgi:hypothetical protein